MKSNIITAQRMDMMWMFGPAIERITARQKRFAQYPNSAPGQDFDGYENL